MIEEGCAHEKKGHGDRDYVSILLPADSIGAFFPLLQSGVVIPANVPCALWNLLRKQLGLSCEYISERITTIFVDGKATDDLDHTVVRDGATIALSAAMPGVVGATLRRGSFYAAMRSDITSTDIGIIGKAEGGTVCVKLFNLLLHDLGPVFLKRGILMAASDLGSLLQRITEQLHQSPREFIINGKSVAPECSYHLGRYLSRNEVKLSVEFI
jgi:hypothetical protein